MNIRLNVWPMRNALAYFCNDEDAKDFNLIRPPWCLWLADSHQWWLGGENFQPPENFEFLKFVREFQNSPLLVFLASNLLLQFKYKLQMIKIMIFFFSFFQIAYWNAYMNECLSKIHLKIIAGACTIKFKTKVLPYHNKLECLPLSVTPTPV